MQHADAIAFLKATHRTLAEQEDLSPNNPEVNNCLGTLVATLRSWQAAGFGAELSEHPELADVAAALPSLCAAAEAAMEKWWCRKILASPCPGAQALAAFWYLDEYRALCQSELALLGDRRAERFAFLGSGALPLTAILVAQSGPGIEGARRTSPDSRRRKHLPFLLSPRAAAWPRLYRAGQIAGQPAAHQYQPLFRSDRYRGPTWNFPPATSFAIMIAFRRRATWLSSSCAISRTR